MFIIILMKDGEKKEQNPKPTNILLTVHYVCIKSGVCINVPPWLAMVIW